MIVPTMSYPEIYRVLENAAPKLRYKMEQLRPKAVKYFTREVRNFPALKTYEYTIPATNDTYTIFFCAADEKSAEKPISGSFCFLRHWNPWQVMLVREMAPDLAGIPFESSFLYTYTSHFFDRYRERHMKKTELPIMDAICQFFARNRLFINLCKPDNRLWTDMQDEVTEERIGGRCAIQIGDGLELARVWETEMRCAQNEKLPEMIVIKALTFIPRDMYFSDQSDSSAEHMVELGKYYMNSLDRRPVDPNDFEEIVRRNRIRMYIEDLEDTL